MGDWPNCFIARSLEIEADEQSPMEIFFWRAHKVNDEGQLDRSSDAVDCQLEGERTFRVPSGSEPACFPLRTLFFPFE